ncbi:hypothetical protein B566_EDAN007469 [Ephemera danica]|nr:hypothetical protein B566_EDAN007469 [Ephemera danica]
MDHSQYLGSCVLTSADVALGLIMRDPSGQARKCLLLPRRLLCPHDSTASPRTNGCAFVSAAFGNTGSAHNALQPAGSPPPPPPPPLPPLGRNEPYFDPMTPRNVTALVGKSAYLSCRVRNLGNKTEFSDTSPLPPHFRGDVSISFRVVFGRSLEISMSHTFTSWPLVDKNARLLLDGLRVTLTFMAFTSNGHAVLLYCCCYSVVMVMHEGMKGECVYERVREQGERKPRKLLIWFVWEWQNQQQQQHHGMPRENMLEVIAFACQGNAAGSNKIQHCTYIQIECSLLRVQLLVREATWTSAPLVAADRCCYGGRKTPLGAEPRCRLVVCAMPAARAVAMGGSPRTAAISPGRAPGAGSALLCIVRASATRLPPGASSHQSYALSTTFAASAQHPSE